MSNQNNGKHGKQFGAFPQQPVTSTAEAQENRRKRRIPSDIVNVPNAGDVQQRALTGGNPLGIPSIPEQARALRNNVDLIYQHVHDNVTFIPTYGLHKGGLGALVDGSGNAFDQCDLMIKLLREQSAYTAQYVIGSILLNAPQWSSWLGVDQNDLDGAAQLLVNGGIGCDKFPATNQLLLDHCWVKVTIDGTDYYFDPAMKAHTVTAGINIADAIGYNPVGQPTFLDDAKAGATIDPNGNSVRNINYTNVNSKLTNYSTNLINWIKQNNPGASLDQILGGRSIVPTSGTIRNTSLPYADSIDSVSNDVPDDCKAYFRFEYDAIPGTNPVQYRIDVAFWTADLYGQRLTLFWDASGIASLRYNGTQVGNSSAPKAAGAMEYARLTVFHPYATSFANESALTQIQGRAPTFIGTQFGISSKYLAGIHQEIQNGYVAAGFAASSEPLLGTSLNLIWDNFIGQSSDGMDILSRIANASTLLHHCVGTISQATKPGTSTNIKSISSFLARFHFSARSVGVDFLPPTFATALLFQALEGTASEQVTGIECGDPIKVVSICNQSGVDIYDAKSSNWNTGINVRSILYNGGTGYNNTVLNDIESWLNIGSGWRVVVPNDPTVTIGAFNDFYGYLPLGPDHISVFSETWFGAKGAASAAGQGDGGTNSAAFDNARQVNGFGMPSVTAYESARVNMLNGRYEYSSNDLTVGNQGAPYELAFTRSYNSALRLSLAKISSADQGLGFGWTHNWLMKASVNSDGFIPMGDQQVSAAAAAIASMYVMRDVAATDINMPVANFVVECEIARFLVKQFTGNVVHLQFGASFQSFTKMPDGSYLPPLGAHAASLLTKQGTSPNEFFKYTTPDKVVFTFKTTGEIDKIEYPFGITINFTYTSGLLTKVSNGFRELNFVYDGFQQLASVNDGNGRIVTLTIPPTGPLAGNLTSVTDPLNKATTYNYDQRGRLTQVFKPANPTSPLFTNIYDTLSRVKEQRDAYNNLWQFFLAGSRSEEVAPNNTSRVLYFNSMGSITRNINALGQETTTQYDGNQRPTLLTLPEGNSLATTYDASGNVLAVTQHAKPGSGLADRTTSYTYETAWNRVATVTDFAGNTTTNEYYPAGVNGASQLKKITGPAVAAGTAITQFEYNNKGQLLKTTDPTGLVTSNSYEATKNNLVTTAVDPLGLNISTSFTFDAVGNALTVTDPKGNVTTSVYDSSRRVTQVTGPAPFNQVAFISYDDNGNVLQTQSLAATDPNSQISKSTYAIDGKVLTQVGPDNYAQGSQPVPTRYEYDSLRRLLKVTDPLGHIATTVYDAVSRPSSNAIDGVTQQTLAYTTNGLLLSMTDARNNATQYQYDGFDRPTRTTYPDSTHEDVVSYDSRDNVLQAVTRAGDSFQLTYDALSQLLTKTPAGQPTVSLTYDLAGRTLTVSTPLVVGDPSTGITTLFYDTAGRMFKEQYPDGKSVITDLDKNDNVTRLTYPDGNCVTNAFDTLDRLTGVSGFGGSVVFGYDSASRRSSQSNGNTTGQGYRYDKADNLLAITTNGLRFSASPLALPQVNFSFNYNAVGQIQSRQCNEPRFFWQPNISSTIAYGTANSVNQYPTVDGVTLSYDPNGCLTNDGTTTYGYDVESRLLSVTGPSSTVGYKYDPLGRLVEKTVGTSKVRYLYSGLQRIEEYDESGTLVRRYIYGAGLDECLFVVDGATSGLTYLHGDETGSTILTTDASGMPTGINVYEPWGELASGSLSDINIGFTGQFYDPDTGLYYFKARHYSPALGRFLQTDPIGYEGGLNLYDYCGGDPVNFTDPLGQYPVHDTSLDVSFTAGWGIQGLPANFAGHGGGSGGGGRLSPAEATMRLYIDTINRAMQAASAYEAAAAAAEQQAAQFRASLAAAAERQRRAIEAAVRLYQGQAGSVLNTIFGPGIAYLAQKPGSLTGDIVATAAGSAAGPVLGVAAKSVGRIVLPSLIIRNGRNAVGALGKVVKIRPSNLPDPKTPFGKLIKKIEEHRGALTGAQRSDLRATWHARGPGQGPEAAKRYAQKVYGTRTP